MEVRRPLIKPRRDGIPVDAYYPGDLAPDRPGGRGAPGGTGGFLLRLSSSRLANLPLALPVHLSGPLDSLPDRGAILQLLRRTGTASPPRSVSWMTAVTQPETVRTISLRRRPLSPPGADPGSAIILEAASRDSSRPTCDLAKLPVVAINGLEEDSPVLRGDLGRPRVRSLRRLILGDGRIVQPAVKRLSGVLRQPMDSVRPAHCS